MGFAGLAFGAAMLAKFAAIYALIGLMLIYLHGHMMRQKLFDWRGIGMALALAFGQEQGYGHFDFAHFCSKMMFCL